MSDTAPEQLTLEELKDALSSKFWLWYRQQVLSEIAGDFEEHITRALDVADSNVALDRMRQVAAVRKAGMRWLKLPKERLDTMVRQEQADQHAALPGRRPMGL